jgi:RNA polymerase sigma-70 factor, ECF subfamily
MQSDANKDFFIAGNTIDEDVELVRKSKKKDVASFEKLYRKYIGRIYSLSLRMSGDSRIADELSQEIFIRVWQKLELFEGRSSFYTWLHRLAVNFILNEQKSRSRHHKNELIIDDNILDSGEKNNIDVSIDLENAISTLPAGAKEVFILYDIQGFQHEEIANLQNISVGTSKSQLHRARKILREVLNYEM